MAADQPESTKTAIDAWRSRRGFCASLLALATASVIAFPPIALARRIRINLGRGIARGGRKTYGPGTMTQSELEECLITEGQLDELETTIERSEANIGSTELKLKSQKIGLEARQRTLNRYSQAEVASFNRSVDAYEGARLDFNENVKSHNALVQQSRDLASRFNQRCANKSYYEDDMDAAKTAVSARKSANSTKANETAKSAPATDIPDENLRRMMDYSVRRY
jgi:hypothetical protein